MLPLRFRNIGHDREGEGARRWEPGPQYRQRRHTWTCASAAFATLARLDWPPIPASGQFGYRVWHKFGLLDHRGMYFLMDGQLMIVLSLLKV